MNQGFYYQFTLNETNFSSYSNACSGSSTDWVQSSACNPPAISNRADFGLFSDSGYLWWHTLSSADGSLIKFVAPFAGEFFLMFLFISILVVILLILRLIMVFIS